MYLAMSPVFTSGKLKGMISLMDGALDNMINYLNKAGAMSCSKKNKINKKILSALIEFSC